MTSAQRRRNYLQTRRDARVAIAGWLLTLAWVVGVSWWLGSERPTVLWFGIPKWVLLGVGIPWIATFAFNTWFSAVLLAEPGDAPSNPSPEKRGTQ
ncbi:MAG: hypothetical protein U5J83_14210 [Bryobacterales bacterium]|nr:hypothetical protein [Bryobacterales bacterium]